MFLDRNGYLEETFFTFSFSPIRDESGGVGGALSSGHGNHLTNVERKAHCGPFATWRRAPRKSKTVEEACELTSEVLDRL